MDDLPATKADLRDLQRELKQDFATLTDLVIAGFETMNQRFDRLEARVDRLEARMDRVQSNLAALTDRVGSLEQRQREHTDWLQRLDGRLAGVENDVKELYVMTETTRKEFAARLKREPKQEARLRKVEAFARAASRKVGVTFS